MTVLWACIGAIALTAAVVGAAYWFVKRGSRP